MKNYMTLSLRRLPFLSCLLKMIPVLTGMLTARLLSRIVDGAFIGNTGMVIRWGALLLGLVAALKVFQYLSEAWYRKKESKVVHNCKMNLYRMLLDTPLSRLYTFGFGEAKEKLTDDFQTVMGKYTSLYPGVISGILTVVIYFSFLAQQKMIVAVILLVMSFILLIPPIIIKRFLQVNYKKCREMESALYNFTVSGYRGFLTIKLFGLKQWWLDKLKEYHKVYLKIGSESICAANTESALMEFSSTVVKYGTYSLLGIMVLFGKVEHSVAVEAIALSSGFFSAIQALFSTIPQFGVAKMAQMRLDKWGDDKNLVTKNQGPDGWKNEILLREVTYGIDEKLIFDRITITLDEEKCYLVKGENGAGKSTLFRLLIGLIPCMNGQISVGGYNPVEWGDEVLQRHIFYLAQEDVKFDLTPMEVYEMVEPDLKDAIVQNAVEFGLAEEQLQHVRISELSGGERKKVYLSLAFAQDFDILFLDEPTNSLDEKGKQVLVTKLAKRTGSTWIISHDPVLDSVTDAILRVEEGGIIFEKM